MSFNNFISNLNNNCEKSVSMVAELDTENTALINELNINKNYNEFDHTYLDQARSAISKRIVYFLNEANRIFFDKSQLFQSMSYLVKSIWTIVAYDQNGSTLDSLIELRDNLLAKMICVEEDLNYMESFIKNYNPPNVFKETGNLESLNNSIIDAFSFETCNIKEKITKQNEIITNILTELKDKGQNTNCTNNCNLLVNEYQVIGDSCKIETENIKQRIIEQNEMIKKFLHELKQNEQKKDLINDKKVEYHNLEYPTIHILENADFENADIDHNANQISRTNSYPPTSNHVPKTSKTSKFVEKLKKSFTKEKKTDLKPNSNNKNVTCLSASNLDDLSDDSKNDSDYIVVPLEFLTNDDSNVFESSGALSNQFLSPKSTKKGFFQRNSKRTSSMDSRHKIDPASASFKI